MMRSSVRIQTQAFDLTAETTALKAADAGVGACAVFVGYVREQLLDAEEGAGQGHSNGLEALELEHYPGMTERSIEALIERAGERYALLGVSIVHRVGRLELGEPIVYVGVSSAHRRDAFEACAFLMDQLKTQVPLWKKSHGARGAQWVAARASDDVAAARWEEPASALPSPSGTTPKPEEPIR